MHSRKVRTESDRLILSTVNPAILSGRRANVVITWQRIETRAVTEFKGAGNEIGCRSHDRTLRPSTRCARLVAETHHRVQLESRT
jgi:hypothetical protein